MKLDMWKEVDSIAKDGAFLATNTSSLPVIAQAASTSRPERFVGLHFFNPAQVMKLLEVVRCVTTSEEALQVGTEFGQRLGKLTVSEHVGSWRLTRQREPGRKLTVTGRGQVGPLERCSSLYRLITLRGSGVIGAHSGGAVPKWAVRQPDDKWRLPERRVDYE